MAQASSKPGGMGYRLVTRTLPFPWCLFLEYQRPETCSPYAPKRAKRHLLVTKVNSSDDALQFPTTTFCHETCFPHQNFEYAYILMLIVDVFVHTQRVIGLRGSMQRENYSEGMVELLPPPSYVWNTRTQIQQFNSFPRAAVTASTSPMGDTRETMRSCHTH